VPLEKSDLHPKLATIIETVESERNTKLNENMNFPETQTLHLTDGRKLAFCDIGDPEGIPVLYFHGWPACRYESILYSEGAKAKNVRLLAVDRPGMGKSDYLRKRTMLDWPADVEALADHLNLETFHVLGHSGGGPYALVCAAMIADRIPMATVVAGLSPMADPRTREGMRKLTQFLLSVGRYCPPILSGAMRVMRKMGNDPDKLKNGMKDLPEIDQRIIDKYLSELVELTADCFQNGVRGATQEGVIYSKPWGFDPATIEIPVTIWQGDLDINVPISNSQLLADIIPDAKLNIFEGEGHFSLGVNHGVRIFEAIQS